MAYLALVRHGQSEWNKQGLWTGWKDIPLSEEGKIEAQKAGEQLKNYHFDIAFDSTLSRAKQTREIIQNILNLPHLKIIEDKALNERDYGDYTGKNKWEIQKEVGQEQFKKIRRGLDVPVPNGETLKNVYERVVPFYTSTIEPELKQGKNVLVNAHGNSLRALVKYLDKLSDSEVEKLEIPTGEIILYEVGSDGNTISKKILSSNPTPVSS